MTFSNSSEPKILMLKDQQISLQFFNLNFIDKITIKNKRKNINV